MIIDFHTHIFPEEVRAGRALYAARDPWFGTLYARRARMASAEELVVAMDQAGVDVAVAFGFSWADHDLCVQANDYLIEATRRYPGRIIGFACIQPRAGRRAVAELERCLAAGLRGVAELMPDGQGYDLGDETVLKPLIQLAVEAGVPVVAHASEPVGHAYPGKGTVTPQALYRLASRFPALKLVAAHWGGGLAAYELMTEVAHTLRNVYYDTAASFLLYRPEIFSLAASLLGHKILFGTDYPLVNTKRFLERVRDTGLSDDQLANILGENARGLLCLT
jgi:uncharacterized protein